MIFKQIKKSPQIFKITFEIQGRGQMLYLASPSGRSLYGYTRDLYSGMQNRLHRSPFKLTLNTA